MHKFSMDDNGMMIMGPGISDDEDLVKGKQLFVKKEEENVLFVTLQ